MADQPSPKDALAAQPRASVTVVMPDGQRGEHQLNPGETVVGRGRASGLVIAEETVSRSHLKLVLDGQGLWAEDLGSHNGTQVNGVKISKQRLVHGDRLKLGNCHLEVALIAAPARGRPAAQAPGRPRRAPSGEPRPAAPGGRLPGGAGRLGPPAPPGRTAPAVAKGGALPGGRVGAYRRGRGGGLVSRQLQYQPPRAWRDGSIHLSAVVPAGRGLPGHLPDLLVHPVFQGLAAHPVQPWRRPHGPGQARQGGGFPVHTAVQHLLDVRGVLGVGPGHEPLCPRARHPRPRGRRAPGPGHLRGL
ncbi:MAG: FHA domain-containing protein [Desulfarculus sp.]|nr:FHA domain-containing protein [Desulfarculus sp.]